MACRFLYICLGLVMVSVFVEVGGWGGLFNRFSPELLSNLGYGGQHQHSSYKAQPLVQNMEKGNLEEILEEESSVQENCYARKCSSNADCCNSHACVDVDGVLGTCLPTFGARQGEMCLRDGECESGLICAGSHVKYCVPVQDSKKQYGEDCVMSSDCDISKGLCCQVQRRHRQAPRKACSYFKDPLICVGPVAMEQIRQFVEHTTGEKRIAGTASEFNHLR